MYPVTARFLDAIRRPPGIYTRVEVWFDGERVDGYGDDGIPVHGGNVDVDPGKQVRRTLTGVEVDATDAMWNLLSPVGTQLRAYRGFRYLNGEVDAVPLGVFVVPNLSETYGGNWGGQIGTASDPMILVQRARFTTPRAILPGRRVIEVIAELVSEILGPVAVMSDSQAVTGSGLLYERDRGKAIGELAAAAAVDVFCSPDGAPTIRDTPQLADTGVWTVDPGDDGVLYTATRERTHERTYSGVVVAADLPDGAPGFDPVEVWDEDPLSPTYYLGPFGKVPYFFTSPLVRGSGDALAVAYSLLPKVTAPRAQLTLEAECNPALADGDTITVTLPPRQRGSTRVTERHLVGPFTVPLTADGVQHIDTASSAPDVEDSE